MLVRLRSETAARAEGASRDGVGLLSVERSPIHPNETLHIRADRL